MDARYFLALQIDEMITASEDSFGRESTDLGAKRLTKWKTSSAFSQEEVWQKYLNSLGIRESELVRVLSATPKELQAAIPLPEWLMAFECARGAKQDESEQKNIGINGYLPVLWPWIKSYRQKLIDHLDLREKQAPGLVERNLVLTSFTDTLLAKLRRVLQKTLVLETNIARLENRLVGDTPEKRFENFLLSLHEPDTREKILVEYPCLVRDIIRILEQWLLANTEFLDRYYTDAKELPSFFSMEKLGPLQKVHGGAGDAHRNGRSVFILEFSQHKLVYKPRALAADLKFQSLLSWLSSDSLDYRTYAILDKGTYGWVEFVPFQEMQTQEQMERFYLRQGGLIALLYALGTTDMHLENVIASGEYPMVIDLETIFHPRFLPLSVEPFAEEIANERMQDSVMSIGILPAPVRSGGRTMDKSGLGATANQAMPVDIDGFVALGTDEVHVSKVPGRIGEIYSQPSLRGIRPDVHEYRIIVQKGFSQTYRYLREKKSELLAADGPLSVFRGIPIRAVVRPSATYASILSESSHPKMLRNSFQREFLFSQLWDEVRFMPAFEKLIPSERKQLFSGDIPYFMTSTDSKDLTGGDGTKIANALTISGFEVAMNRIQRMSEEDLAYQSWLIDAAFSSTNINGTFVRRFKPKPSLNYIEAACIVADRLAETAVRHRGTITWPCLVYDSGGSSEEEGSYRLGVCDYGLYRGQAGIALFLAQLAKLSGKDIYRQMAEESLATILEKKERWIHNASPGAFTGLAAYIYLFTHLGVLWNRSDLLDEAVSLLENFESNISNDTSLDIIGGSAGAIPVLLGLARIRPESKAKNLAIACGEKLVSESLLQGEEKGLYWKSLSMPRGFSHGATGIAWSLGKLFEATGEERYANAARLAMVYERNLLVSGIWSDIPGNEQSNYWCHGAPGIALGRLGMNPKIDPLVKADAEKALELMAANREISASILCHGDLGNMDSLIAAKRVFGADSKWAKLMEERSQIILADFNRFGWATPLPAYLAEPGLMMGLAGIGYGFLRLAKGDLIPSILGLDLPI